MRERKQVSSRNIFIRIIQIILILVILYSLIRIGTYMYSRYKAGKKYDSLTDMVSETARDVKKDRVITKKEDETDGEELDTEINFFEILKLEDFDKYRSLYDQIAKDSIAKFKKINTDVYSFINMPGFNVSYPVVFRDNKYYLYLDIDEEWSQTGSLFIEEKNNPDFSDINTTIYGHNMTYTPFQNAEMFEPLLKFEDVEFVNSKKEHFIDIFTEKGVYRYLIFSAYYVDAAEDYRRINMPVEERIPYFNTLKSRSIHEFGDISKYMKEDSQYLTLSTCDNVTRDGRFTVHAIRVR